MFCFSIISVSLFAVASLIDCPFLFLILIPFHIFELWLAVIIIPKSAFWHFTEKLTTGVGIGDSLKITLIPLDLK